MPPNVSGLAIGGGFEATYYPDTLKIAKRTALAY